MFSKRKLLYITMLAILGIYSESYAIGHINNADWEKIAETLKCCCSGTTMDKGCNTCKPLCCNVITDTLDNRTHGTLKVATDNNNNPVNMSYATLGTKESGKTTVIFADLYLGKNGWKCAQEALSHCYYTVAIDPIGSGESDKPEPTDMDGVKGFPGYSFDQTAAIMHKFIARLNIDGPIIYVAIDPQGQPAMKYAVTYAADPLAITKLVLIDSSVESIVSDNPCEISFLTTASAALLAGFFSFDPCAASCALFAGSFADPACTDYANTIYNEAVNYLGGTIPPSVFTRLFTQTFLEDVSALMAEIEIPVLYLYGVINQSDLISRMASGITFMGACPNCVLRPTAPGTCPANRPYILPFTDIQFLTFAGKGTGLWLTDHKRFIRALKDFINGCNLQCCPCPKEIGNPVVCPVC